MFDSSSFRRILVVVSGVGTFLVSTQNYAMEKRTQESLEAVQKIPVFDQPLVEAENRAREYSSSLKSSSATIESAEGFAKSVGSNLWPNLSLQGSYNYQTQVPSLVMGPLGRIQFGTHDNYAVGPVLKYTLFDGGKNRQGTKSAELLLKAKQDSYEVLEKQLELNLRQTYFRVQYALKELFLISNSLELSQAQAKDIDLRFRAGASSKLDQTQAHRAVLGYQLKFRQSQTNLAAGLRELIALTGTGLRLDTSHPIPVELYSHLPLGIDEPSMRVNLDSLQTTLKRLGSGVEKSTPEISSNHPELKMYLNQAEASRLSADSEKSGLWPKIELQAKSQYIYPNVVIAETVLQNTFGVTLSMPLFEGDASRGRAAQKLSDAVSSEAQKEQRQNDLVRDAYKARDLLVSLKSQQKISDQNIKEAEEVEKLTYQSYKAGKARYLDVQDSDLKLLEANLTAAQIQSGILNQLALLTYLEAHSKTDLQK